VIVADTSLIAELWLPGQHGELALDVLYIDSDWHAPLLWRSEFRSAMGKYLRANLIDKDYAKKASRYSLEFMSQKEFDIEPLIVLELLSDSTVSAYDAEFVALALELDCSLLSFDQKLIKLFPTIAMHPSDFVAAASS
jgi:predicted nucleic acid-binding protein